ncbi:PREDICTED: uncharacterized protein LOC105457304 isoform X2 [Wasmannia auropunctata]|uniref:uncharacterized protein LOC105457304 isoform X2 n=1 Tax=Wasmannia auropunctata TaxID=64793 RepID=UPI0005EF9924|nr:PREDICTED: uncharacterized protein LOC105457304 isoform X2 [Wasmannia auropunctata]
MSREVAMAHTSVKKVEGKQILKTTFSSCIKEVVTEEYSKSHHNPPITDKIYYSTLGSVLNNAKDWEGHQLMRQKKMKPIQNEWEEYYVFDNDGRLQKTDSD